MDTGGGPKGVGGLLGYPVMSGQKPKCVGLAPLVDSAVVARVMEEERVAQEWLALASTDAEAHASRMPASKGRGVESTAGAV
jgi:hypothetical protein